MTYITTIVIALTVILVILFFYFKGRKGNMFFNNIAMLIQTLCSLWVIWFAAKTIENNNLLYNSLPDLDTNNFKYENKLISFNIINKGTIDALIENISLSFENPNNCIQQVLINDREPISTPYENNKLQIYGNDKDKYLYDIFQEHSQAINIELQFETDCLQRLRKNEIDFKFQFTYKTINQKSGYYVFTKRIRVY